MTPLRQRMDDAMVLRGFALRTRESYLAAVSALAKHYRRSPDLLTPEEMRAWLLHLIVERRLAYASVNQMNSACRFLFEKVLRRPAVRFDIPMAKSPKTLPRILSREEVARLFDAAANLRARTLLMAAYAAGLRVSEVCALQLADIESAHYRMCIKVLPWQGWPRSLHHALARLVGQPARVLVLAPSRHMAVPQPREQRGDRSADRAAHVLRGTRSGRPGPPRRYPHLAPLFRHAPLGIRC